MQTAENLEAAVKYTGVVYVYELTQNELFGFRALELSLDEIQSNEWVIARLIGKFEGILAGELAEKLIRERSSFFMGEG